MHISRESISLLLPHVQLSYSKVPPMNEGATGSGGNSDDPREVQEVCMQVVTIAANDSVLKVFLAALVSITITCIPCLIPRLPQVFFLNLFLHVQCSIVAGAVGACIQCYMYVVLHNC